MALSIFQALVLSTLQQALEKEEKLELSLKEISDRMKETTGDSLKGEYLSKIIASIPKAILPEEVEEKEVLQEAPQADESPTKSKKGMRWKRKDNPFIQSFYKQIVEKEGEKPKNVKHYFLNGATIVTRKDTAQIILEVRRQSSLTGKIPMEDFLQAAKENEQTAHLNTDWIRERLLWASQMNTAYITIEEDKISPAKRLFEELTFLNAIASG